jgi:eukaryotic-like serine/threonine-protein kinase
MGVILLAHHEALDQRVAIKVILEDLTEEKQVVVRFTREARAAAKLQSEHVVRVTDVGEFEGVGPYMVMEYLSGTDFGSLLADRGAFPVSEAVDYLLEAIDAIAEAHSVGIVHRDLKPANLFLARRKDGTKVVKVLDFGISKMDPLPGNVADEHALTSAKAILGTPSYMSPEQLRSAKGVDARADIWSLGVVLYELLTKVRPFDGDTFGELFTSVVSRDPKPLRAHRANIPAGLEAIVLRCLRRDPGERYADVAELAQALLPFGSGRTSKEVARATALLCNSERDAPSSTMVSLAHDSAAPTVEEHWATSTRAPKPAAVTGSNLPSSKDGPSTQGAWDTRPLSGPRGRRRVAWVTGSSLVILALAIVGSTRHAFAPPVSDSSSSSPAAPAASSPAAPTPIAPIGVAEPALPTVEPVAPATATVVATPPPPPSSAPSAKPTVRKARPLPSFSLDVQH